MEQQEPKLCGCGKIQNPDGYCDGTHNKKEE
jgi:CDGSH-type Zn-finger protein